MLQNILPGVSNVVLQIATRVLLPAILDALPGGGTPSLPSGANNIALGGATTQLSGTQGLYNSTFNRNFT
ncbi:MAG: hypothetical protein ACFCAD_07725 [Pleurocapsa sp.]